MKESILKNFFYVLFFSLFGLFLVPRTLPVSKTYSSKKAYRSVLVVHKPNSNNYEHWIKRNKKLISSWFKKQQEDFRAEKKRLKKVLKDFKKEIKTKKGLKENLRLILGTMFGVFVIGLGIAGIFLLMASVENFFSSLIAGSLSVAFNGCGIVLVLFGVCSIGLIGILVFLK
jgi:Flp pilus assembly protein TadB